MATLDDVLNAIGRHENRGVRAGGEMTEHAIAESDAAVAPAGNPSRLDAWSEGAHPRDKEGKFSETSEGKKLAGFSAGAVEASNRGPSESARGYSKAAHSSTQRALGNDRPEHHQEAMLAHRAAGQENRAAAVASRNAAGNPNQEHMTAHQLHEWSEKMHEARLNELRKRNGHADSASTARLDAMIADCDRYDRRDAEGRSDVHIGWNAMVRKLQGEGHSKESAEKIAGYINKKKNG